MVTKSDGGGLNSAVAVKMKRRRTRATFRREYRCDLVVGWVWGCERGMSEVKGQERPPVPGWQLGCLGCPLCLFSAAELADPESRSLSVSWDVPPPLLTMPPWKDCGGGREAFRPTRCPRAPGLRQNKEEGLKTILQSIHRLFRAKANGGE